MATTKIKSYANPGSALLGFDCPDGKDHPLRGTCVCCSYVQERKTRMILGSLGLAFALALVGSPAHTEVDTPQRPDVSLEIVPDREGVERGEQLPLVLIVTNKSDTPLAAVTVSVPSASFQRVPAAFPDTIAAFGTVQGTITLQPCDNKQSPAFGPHKVPLVVEYTWLTPKRITMRSAQTGTVSLNVLRRFEEEAKSLPGGTAAFLYLILPIVPAFFAFFAVNQLRRGEKLQMPKFGSEYILPAFLLSLLMSVGIVTLRSFDVDLAYADPRKFVSFLAASAMLGALVPGGRWGYAVVVRRRWNFRQNDSLEDYLRKALLGPQARPDSELLWVEGKADNETWKGMQLFQPDGAPVLGARLQVTPESADENLRKELWTILTTEVFDSNNALIDRRRLVKMVEAHNLTIVIRERIMQGGQPLDAKVATEGLTQFKATASTSKPLVEPIR